MRAGVRLGIERAVPLGERPFSRADMAQSRQANRGEGVESKPGGAQATNTAT
jgi:hypothetical protein